MYHLERVQIIYIIKFIIRNQFVSAGTSYESSRKGSYGGEEGRLSQEAAEVRRSSFAAGKSLLLEIAFPSMSLEIVSWNCLMKFPLEIATSSLYLEIASSSLSLEIDFSSLSLEIASSSLSLEIASSSLSFEIVS